MVRNIQMPQRFERNISIPGRSPRTFDNYSRHVAAIALHFQCLPTDLDTEQVKDYLYELQQRSQTPSQTYFKHTVYGLRFLLKTEGLPYDHLHLPEIARPKTLPVIPSRQEIWAMLKKAQLLKHRILIGLLYGCGLRCQEVRNLQLRLIDFDRRLLHIVQSKGNKDRYVVLSEHLIRGIRKYISIEHPKQYLFEGTGNPEGKGFDGRYSQRGVQRAVKTVARQARYHQREVHTHMLRHTYATHLLEDGVNIIAVQKLMGHANIDSTMVYLHVCRLPEQLPQSPLKVAISNHRIQEVNEHEVSFSYKDYKAGGSKKQMTLRNEEFVRRFSQHILPKRFVRIRHYGSLSSHWKRGRLQALQKELKVTSAGKAVRTMLRQCPCCKTGILLTIEIFGQRGPPTKYLSANQHLPVA